MKSAIEMRQERQKELFLEHLRRVPIIQLACDKVDVSRVTIYRWRKESDEFSQAVDDAIGEGLNFINDLSEAQVVTLIKERKMSAISLWLKARHSAYKSGAKAVSNSNEPFTVEITNYDSAPAQNV